MLKKIGNINVMKSVLMLLLFFSAVSGNTQDMFVDIECTNQYPGVGENIKLSYVLKMKMKNGVASFSHSGYNVEKPDFEKLTIVDEGTEGTSFGFGNMGGGAMQVAKYSFILSPNTKGKETIKPFSFIINGNTYTSDSYSINIGQADPKLKNIPKNSNLFGKISISKSKLMVGQPALVTYKLYSRYNGGVQTEKADFPMAKSIWREEIKPPASGWGYKQENIGGKIYNVFTIQKEIIFPQKSGKLEIPAFEMKLKIGGGFFSKASEHDVRSNDLIIDVVDLPGGAPDSFDGLVGTNIEMEYDYSTTELTAGEPLEIDLKVSGKGNLKKIGDPEISFPSDFEVYDPETKQSFKVTASGITGYKSYNYLVIPRYHGTYTLPAFELTYYDLEKEQYVTLSKESQEIKVNKSATSQAKSDGIATPKNEVKTLNEDIRHISEEVVLTKGERSFFGSLRYWIWIIIPLIISIVFMQVFAWQSSKVVDEQLAARKKAGKMAFKSLRAAEQSLTSSNSSSFYNNLQSGIYDYLKNKFSLEKAMMNRNSISNTLLNAKLDESLVKQVITILDQCDMARFAPSNAAKPEELLSQTKELLNQIEKNA